MADSNSRRAGAVRLARAQGVFNMACGLWPAVHMSSYEKVFGSRTDRFLVRTIGSLLVGLGLNQLRAAAKPDGLPYAKRIGTSAALTQLRLDVINVVARRVPATYLIDAAAQAGWLYAWRQAVEEPPPRAKIGGEFGAALGTALAGAAVGGGAALAGQLLAQRTRRPVAGERDVTERELQPV